MLSTALDAPHPHTGTRRTAWPRSPRTTGSPPQWPWSSPCMSWRMRPTWTRMWRTTKRGRRRLGTLTRVRRAVRPINTHLKRTANTYRLLHACTCSLLCMCARYRGSGWSGGSDCRHQRWHRPLRNRCVQPWMHHPLLTFTTSPPHRALGLLFQQQNMSTRALLHVVVD